jgi:hypothetical protein
VHVKPKRQLCQGENFVTYKRYLLTMGEVVKTCVPIDVGGNVFDHNSGVSSLSHPHCNILQPRKYLSVRESIKVFSDAAS